MSQSAALDPLQEDAFTLVEIAMAMDSARSDKNCLAAALERNLKTWIGIDTLVRHPDTVMTLDARENLQRLSRFVASTILRNGVGIAEETLDTLVNINLQISDGLLGSCQRPH